jgi:hypothetical protein
VREGKLSMISPRKADYQVRNTFFYFDEFFKIYLYYETMLYCKKEPFSKKKMKYVGEINISKTVLQTLIDGEGVKNAFQLSDQKETFTFCTKTLKSKEEWIQSINVVLIHAQKQRG